MKAADVMVSKVITVGVDASIGEVAGILLSNHISGVPVVGEKGEVVGIVSEGDLMRRPETGTTRRPSWWLALLSSDRSSAGEYIKSHSRKVADVMTRNVISATPDTSLGDIAAMLERNRIKRVPIFDGGKLVGIVTRANILQALASATKKLPSLASADDFGIAQESSGSAGRGALAPDDADRHGSRRHRRSVGTCPLSPRRRRRPALPRSSRPGCAPS